MRKRKINKKSIVIAAILGVVVTALFVVMIFHASSEINTHVEMSVKPDNSHDRTIKVVADADYEPYSFLDKNGEPSGHDIELIYMLANRLGVNVEIELMLWSDAQAAVKNGEADIIMAIPYTREVKDDYEISIPIINDPFLVFGSEPYNSIGELYEKKLAVLTGTGVISDFILPYNLSANTKMYNTNTEAFNSVVTGECDYVIARYSVGRREIADLKGVKSIQAVGPTLLSNYLCIGAKKGNTALIEEINGIVTSLSKTGEMDKLSDKWLGSYVQTLSFIEYIIQNIGVIIFAAIIILIIVLIFMLIYNEYRSKKKEMLLIRNAERDSLTGLYNRAVSETLISRKLKESDPVSDSHALLIIDIDLFKNINDTLGHMHGDNVLCILSGSLRTIFRAGDIVGRLGGDEFFVFMYGCSDESIASEKAAMICEAFKNRYTINDKTCEISASVGIAMYPTDGEDFAALYKSADIALYHAKKNGKHGYAIYRSNGEHVYSDCNG